MKRSTADRSLQKKKNREAKVAAANSPEDFSDDGPGRMASENIW